MPNLTDTLIRAAQPPERGQVTLTDTNLKNFGIRISQGGSKTFVVMLGNGRRHTIGRYPLVSLADARKEARRILAEKELGRIHPTRTAFDDAKQNYLSDCVRKNKERTVCDYGLFLNRLPFGRRPLADITPREIIRRLRDFDETPSLKHHVYTAARAFFGWCVREHLIDRSPMENMETPSNGVSRERVLSTDELKAVWKATETPYTHFSAIVRLLILTGQRRGEISRLEWNWINQDERIICIPSTATKNGRQHAFPYGDMVQAILNQTPRYGASVASHPYVFPAARQRNDKTTVFNGFSKGKATLDKKSGITGYTLHDIRRSYSSIMASLGVPQVVVEKLLNHVSGGTLSPIASVYNRHAYMNEMRDAVLRYEVYLTTLIAPTA